MLAATVWVGLLLSGGDHEICYRFGNGKKFLAVISEKWWQRPLVGEFFFQY
jgi:hypothetical protein